MCRPAPPRCPPPPSCWPSRHESPVARRASCARRPRPDGIGGPRACSWPHGCAASTRSSRSAARRPSPRMAYGTATRAQGGQDLRARQCLGHRGQTDRRGRRRRCRARHAGRPVRGPGDRRRVGASRLSSRPTCSRRPSTSVDRAGRAGHDLPRGRRGLHRRGRAPDGGLVAGATSWP